MRFFLVFVLLSQLSGCMAIAQYECRNEEGYDWDECMDKRGMLDLSKNDRFCMDHVKDGSFADQKACKWALANTPEYLCGKTGEGAKEPAGFDKCVWRYKNPIEARCEDETKEHPGYWDCVRIGHEREDRQEALEEQRLANQQRLYEMQMQRIQNSSTTCWTTQGAYGSSTTTCN